MREDTTNNMPDVSILIRSKNDRDFIRQTLTMLNRQQSINIREIICCDDHSEDGTDQVQSAFHTVTMLTAPPPPYRPGKTLNHMVRKASGDIIVFNNADAIPLDRMYLHNLIRPIVQNQADAVYGNQLPRPDAEALVRKDNMRAFGDGSIAAKWEFFFSLASAAIPRKTLLDFPFDEAIRYSEDVEWAHRRPIRIAYAADARVEHSHNYTLAELKRRFYGEGYADAQIFGRNPSLLRALISAMAETSRDLIYLLLHLESPVDMIKSPVRRLVQKLSYRKGTRDYHNQEPHA